jgi:hypothetical protein
MEQKMRQKRQTPGMVQASDVRTVSAKGQNGFQHFKRIAKTFFLQNPFYSIEEYFGN